MGARRLLPSFVAQAGRPRKLYARFGRLWSIGLLATASFLACARPGQVSPESAELPRVAWSPPLTYPPEMYRAGIEGSVVLQAMVDTAGLVEQGSIRVLSSSHEAFEAAAIEMLGASRFLPGRAGERPIRALVRVPVKFQIQSGELVKAADSAAAAADLREGRALAREGQILNAMATLAKAQERDPRLTGMASFWYPLCWYGTLWGHADAVTSACQQLVGLAPNQAWAREARGIARALTGDYEGAIRDLEVAATGTTNRQERAERRTWIDALRAGRNPFTDDVLVSLRVREQPIIP
ncbi:MAG: TonB family protein [Gemmatimonadales bacterium]|nr:TonB family protein [Gemmatimonadales bacterium]